MKLKGVIQDGVGKGAWFTQLGWVLNQCQSILGFKPFPGTLNILINGRGAQALDSLDKWAGGELTPEEPGFCSAQVVKVSISGLAGAIVLPAPEVRVHESNIIEVISPSHLRKELGLSAGDLVEITIHGPGEAS